MVRAKRSSFSNALLASVVRPVVENIINEALITTNPNGRIEFVNRAAAEMWGYTPEELQGKDLHFLIRGQADTLLHRDIVRDTIKLGKIDGEYLFRKKDKGSFPGYLSTSVIREGNRIRGIVMVVADLTRLREIESRLRQSEKLASLGKVVEGVAHEVTQSATPSHDSSSTMWSVWSRWCIRLRSMCDSPSSTSSDFKTLSWRRS